jgi:hypothetical protein
MKLAVLLGEVPPSSYHHKNYKSLNDVHLMHMKKG